MSEDETKPVIPISPKPQLKLDDVLPYPIVSEQTKNDLGSICKREVIKHHHIDYFAIDPHIEAIRDFLFELMKKMGSSETLIYKMGVEAPGTVMNPKEVINQIRELASHSPDLANQFMHLYSWYLPVEDYKWRHRYGVSHPLGQALIRYNYYVNFWKYELRVHTNMVPPVNRLERLLLKKQEALNWKLRQNRVKEGYDNLVWAHEEDATPQYFEIRTTFHRLENKVEEQEQLAKEYKKAIPPLAMRTLEARRRRETRVMTPWYPFDVPQSKRGKSRGEDR